MTNIDSRTCMVLPSAGWFIHHERPDGTVWREPVIGFAVYLGDVGHALIADAHGGVRAAGAPDENTRLIPPDGFLRSAEDDSRDLEPDIDLEMDIIRMIQNSGNHGLTVEEVALRVFADAKVVKERLEHLRAKEMLERSVDRRYSLGNRPVNEVVQVLRHRFTNRGH